MTDQTSCLESQPDAAEQEKPEVTYPTIVRRYFSTVIDSWVIFLSVGIPDLLGVPKEHIVLARLAFFLPLILLYEPLLVVKGCTLGQLLLGIRVRADSDPTKHISIPRSYVRYAAKILFFEISLITVLFAQRARAIHDMIAGSVVIRA
jgi:uncharacterized RDD family membrane protein YckC